MSSNLKVNTILPSTGTSIGIGTAGGSITSNSPLSIASGGINVTGVSTFVTNTDGTTDLLTLHADADGTNNGVASIKLMGNAGNHAAFIKGGHTTNGDSILTFHTDAHASGINPEERLRIDSSGRVMIGNTAAAQMYGGADNLVIGTTSGENGITIISQSNSIGRILFSDSLTSGAATYQGQLNYNHSADELVISTYTLGQIVMKTSNTERLRITSTGQTKLNITSNGALTEPLVIRNGGTGAGTNVGMIFYNGDESTTGAGALAKIKAIDEGSYDGALAFETASKNGWSNTGTSERLRISSEGYVTTPNNVIFSANSGPSDVTNGVLVFSNVVFQRGGTNYNTSNGVFTAPVTGIYHFMCNPYRYVDSADSYIHLQRSTNSGSSWSNEIEIRAFTGSAAGWTTLALSNLIDLNAGWQVRIYCTNRVHTNGTFTRFSGMLVG